jgi:hypothetical protein
MLSVKGLFHNGVAQPDEPIEGYEGQPVIITFLEEDTAPSPVLKKEDAAWDELVQLIEECGVETGISDLAHQHDHYLYGKAKRE